MTVNLELSMHTHKHIPTHTYIQMFTYIINETHMYINANAYRQYQRNININCKVSAFNNIHYTHHRSLIH